MKAGKYIGLLVIVGVFGVIFIPKIVNRFQKKAIIDDNRATSGSPLAYIKLDGEAKKTPDFVFLNQDSLLISNEDYKGKVYVVEFFFTQCPSICPIMNKNMKRIEERFGKRLDFGIASISIDPENDTPSVLKAYSELLGTTSQDWHFLTGDKETIYDLANNGFNIFASVNPAVAGGFEHSGYFALIDKSGFIRSRTDRFGNPMVYYVGVDQESIEIQDVDLLIEDIEKLLKE